MNIDDIKTKIANTEAKVNKIKQTTEKIKLTKDKKIAILNKIFEQNGLDVVYDDIKADEFWIRNYENHPAFAELYSIDFDISSRDEALRDNAKKLVNAEKALQNLTEQLRIEKAKLQYIQDDIPQVIKDFLNAWKNRVKQDMLNQKAQYEEDLKIYQRKINKLILSYLSEHESEYSYLDELPVDDVYGSDTVLRNITYQEIMTKIRQTSTYIKLTEEFNDKYQNPVVFDEDWLDKELDEEMNHKLLDLMSRVTKITGIITDAKLHIQNGDLNGTIIGEDGSAYVETIGAGGYNRDIILDSGRHGQRYHFRVLVKEI